jgi:RimJ/RimL family protein N-acetyltransferase
MPPAERLLREVMESDLPVFFEHQSDPEAVRMADVPSREHEPFMAHWQRILADDALTAKTIVFDGQIAGNVVSWEQDGRRLVGYWIGKEFWGKGLATKALAELVEELGTRPLHAYVAKTNLGSIRVLEKTGFVRSDEDDDLYELR